MSLASFRALIERKRNGGALSAAEIEAFVQGVTTGKIPDYQVSAFLMAVVWRGMAREELGALIGAMTRSGAEISLEHLGNPAVDKHSTGGVGDKVSLIVAPLVAACGVAVPMLSGRGLGHTGGTLDKLESIPGFRTDLTPAEFRDVVAEVGIAMMGQSREIAPADRKLYALRDVTGTVESEPLIVSSILSKKFASGVRKLVFDVKCGQGAFMRTRTEAKSLARALVTSTREMGGAAVALITAMDQPLGHAAGNVVEVRESIQALDGVVAPDLEEVVMAVGAEMLLLGGKAADAAEARALLAAAWKERAGLRKFRQLVAIQGGDARVAERPELLPRARMVLPVTAPSAGWIHMVDARAVGDAVRALGAGREKSSDAVDATAGVVLLKRGGDQVARAELIAEVHAADRARAEAGVAAIGAAYRFAARKPQPPDLIIARVD